MKNKNFKKKLRLKKQTLVNLNQNEMKQLKGGSEPGVSIGSYCHSCTRGPS